MKADSKLNVPLLDLKAEYQLIKQDIDAAVATVSDSQYFILGPEVTALDAARETLALPINPELTDDQLRHVVSAVGQA